MPSRPIKRTPRRVSFGLRVQQLRKERNLSQESFADAAGLHRTYIGSIERGERNVTLEKIWQIAEALGVNPGELLQPVDNSG